MTEERLEAARAAVLEMAHRYGDSPALVAHVEQVLEVIEAHRKLMAEHSALFIELTKAKDQIERLEEKLNELLIPLPSGFCERCGGIRNPECDCLI